MTITKSNPLQSIPSDLLHHGVEIFGTEEGFVKWLNQPNFFFDKKAPIDFMNTSEGIKFIDDQLTGIEYGDNA